MGDGRKVACTEYMADARRESGQQSWLVGSKLGTEYHNDIWVPVIFTEN